jgi:dolichyl-phosphate beta-glucosyltransferase
MSAPSTGGPPTISVILPSFNSAEAVKRSVDEISRFFGSDNQAWEVIVVDDGAADLTPGDLPRDHRVRLLSLPRNRGKGAAVREGMLAASGLVRVYTDADLPFGPSPFGLMVHYILARGFHVVIGDRTLRGSIYGARTSWMRRIASGVFSQFVGKLVTGGFFDTQCGLKGVRGDVAEAIFRSARIDRFAFDVELIYLALIARLDIKRIPVRLVNNNSSSIRLIRDSTRMLLDVFRMKYYRVRGTYQSDELDSIVAADLEQARDLASPHDATASHFARTGVDGNQFDSREEGGQG